MIMYDGDISSHKPCKYARLSSLRGKVNICTIGYKGYYTKVFWMERITQVFHSIDLVEVLDKAYSVTCEHRSSEAYLELVESFFYNLYCEMVKIWS